MFGDLNSTGASQLQPGDAIGKARRHAVRVLCYHAIADLADDLALKPYGIPPDQFEGQIDALLRRGYRFLTPDEFSRFLAGAPVPRKAVLLTFDDCFADLASAAAPLLRVRGIPAIAFAVTGQMTSEWHAAVAAADLELLTNNELLGLTSARIEIGAHSRTHIALSQLSENEIADEIEGSIADLASRGVRRPRFFAYPHGAHDIRVRRVAARAGLEGAFTVRAGTIRLGADPMALRRIEVRRSDSGWRFLWLVASGGFRLSRWAPRSKGVRRAFGWVSSRRGGGA